MAKKDEVKGVVANPERPVVTPKAYDPRRQFMSHDEAVADNAKRKKAAAAAEEARQRVMNEEMGEGKPDSDNGKEESDGEKKVADLRKQLANAQKKLQEKPTSKTWKAKVNEISDALEEAEAELG